ncbi:MAG: hypothetical protein NTY42_14115 [Planctomycetota bacterium]|nr:hypothetical protein [Planctomycetota bacterium]
MNSEIQYKLIANSQRRELERFFNQIPAKLAKTLSVSVTYFATDASEWTSKIP